MPWIGASFTRGFTWVSDVAIPQILRTRHDTNDNDLSGGINDTINKNGANTPTTNLPMGGFNHTGVGNATVRTSYLSMGQFQDNGGKYFTTTGVAPAFVLTPTPAITAYAEGQSFIVKFHQAAAGLDTINISALGAKTLKYNNASIAAGDFVVNTIFEIVYNGTDFVLQGYVSSSSTNVQLARGYIDGLITSNNTLAPNTDIDISQGVCRSDDNSITMNNASTKVKQIDNAWVAGTNTGGMPTTIALTGTFSSVGTAVTGTVSLFQSELFVGDILYSSTNGEGRRITLITNDTSLTVESAYTAPVVGDNVMVNGLAPSTWYHLYVIAKVDGTTDFGFDSRINAPRLLADVNVVAGGYVKKRRIGSVLTNSSSNIRLFLQTGDSFVWDSPILDLSAASSATASLLTITTPFGIKTKAYIGIFQANTANGYTSTYLSDPSQSDIAASINNFTVRSSVNEGDYRSDAGTLPFVNTNTSSQIRRRSDNANAVIDAHIIGWVDNRGKDA